jgi:hypothetical protein
MKLFCQVEKIIFRVKAGLSKNDENITIFVDFSFCVSEGRKNIAEIRQQLTSSGRLMR